MVLNGSSLSDYEVSGAIVDESDVIVSFTMQMISM